MKLLVVGLGGIGQRHVRNLRRLLGDELQLSAYRQRGRRQVLTERLEVDPSADVATAYRLTEYTDLDRALAAGPDAVLVCNPTSLHLPIALTAARAGCDVFIEKPLSDRQDGVDELVDLVARGRLAGAVGYQMRFHPCLRQLRQLLAAKAVGRVITVSAVVGEFMPAWHRYEDYRELYASRRDLGGGVILTQIHELDYLAWLFGTPRRVFALGGHFSRLEVDVEDTASLLLDCAVDGTMVPVHVHQNYTMQPPARVCDVTGEEGRILVDFIAATVEVSDVRGQRTGFTSFQEFDRNDMFMDEMRQFVACVRGEASPIVSIADGARSLRIALAARESIETGAVVSLT
jgi:predicted dehydrogenase